MKKTKLFIALIGILFLFNSSITAGGLTKDEPGEVPVVIEVIYAEDLQEFTLLNKIFDKALKLFPNAFENVKIIIEFGEQFIDSPIETEDWMLEPFTPEDSIEVEKWMVEPLKIS